MVYSGRWVEISRVIEGRGLVGGPCDKADLLLCTRKYLT